MDADRVLGKITEQITERLQVEVRRENARKMQVSLHASGVGGVLLP